MGVVVGDMIEGDKMNAILISEQRNKLENSGANHEQFFQSTGELLTKLGEAIRKVFPFPSLQFSNDLDKVLKHPRTIRNKSVHVLFILLAMVACIAMFSAQPWDIASDDCNEDQTFPDLNDPEDTLARRCAYSIMCEISNRKIIILFFTPITFLLCINLLLLMTKSTTLWMLLSGLISFICSLNAVQCFILVGTNVTSHYSILKLVSLVPSPLLSAIFMAFAYSYMIQVVEEDDVGRNFNIGHLSIPSILILTPPGSLLPTLSLSPVSPVSGKLSLHQSSAYSYLTVILFFFLSFATMTSSTLVMMSTLQGHWNVTHGQGWHQECMENDDHGSATPLSRPDNCYTIELSHAVQKDFSFFSMSQLLLTESILLLCIFITMTGRRIPKTNLFFPGLFLFLAAISTITAFFGGIVQYDLKTNGIPFLILNSANTLTSLIIGFICVIAGGSVFSSCIAFVFRIILSIFMLPLIIIFTAFQSLLKMPAKVNEIPKERKI